MEQFIFSHGVAHWTGIGGNAAAGSGSGASTGVKKIWARYAPLGGPLGAKTC
jgi:hypothetical protein